MAKLVSLTNLSAFWTKVKAYIDAAKAAVLADAKTYADTKVSNLGAVLTFKGTKATLAEVQALTGMQTGDVWHVTANSAEYVYTGTAWEELGTTMDTSAFLTQSDVATGSANGTVAVRGTNVPVKGLGTAAYTASTAYATAAQGAKADTALQPADIEAVTDAEIDALFA